MIHIIIPIYNKIKYLAETLESIDKQQDQNFICWLVDDASTDGSAQLAQQFAATHSNCRFIHHIINLGLSTTLRRTAQLIPAEDYIVMVDADDQLHNRAIKILNTLIIDYHNPEAMEWPLNLSCCPNITINTMLRQSLCQTHRCTSQELLLRKQSILHWGISLLRWNKMLKQSLFIKICTYYDDNLSYAEDDLFCICFYHYVSDLILINDALLLHRALPDTMAHDYSEKHYNSLLHVIEILKTMPSNTSFLQRRLEQYKLRFKNLTEAEI